MNAQDAPVSTQVDERAAAQKRAAELEAKLKRLREKFVELEIAVEEFKLSLWQK